jgi:MFS family permease
MTPAIVRRAGHTRAFAAYAAIVAVATLGLPIATHLIAWSLLRASIGFCFAGLYTIVESWISSKADSGNRGRLLAFYNVVNFMGSAFGQQWLRIADPKSFQLFSATAAFVMLSLVPMAMTRAEPPPLPPKGRLVLGAMLRAAPIGIVGITLVGLANGTFWSLAPAYIEKMGLGPTTVASFMTAVIIASALSPYPIGKLSDRIDRRYVIAASSALAMVAEILLAVMGQATPWALYVAGFFLGTMQPVIYPLITAHVFDRMGTEKGVAISSTLLFLYCAGAVVGPLFASSLMEHFGQAMLFVHNAGAHLLILGFVVWRIIVRPAPQRIEPEPTNPPPAT